jgi:creatinine amidohydrolase/Fe(II)-dependent formamide hydrolase-like protein
MIHPPVGLILAALLLMASKQGVAADQTTAKKLVDKPAPHMKQEVVDIELLTWPEIYKAIHEQGKTTVLLFNGGTEQRGPQGVTGAHNFIAQATADQIARKLGDALVAPVIPYSINRANPNLPGTIGISSKTFADINEEVAEQLIANGFKNVVLLGDHGGGQKELKDVAAKLDAEWASKGVRVVYSDGPYTQANEEFFAWLDKNGYPPSEHAGIPDTSELLYLEGKQHWIRKELLPTALGDPPRKPGEPRDPNAKRINNGISGDARRSSYALGKRFIDLKVADGVAQIQDLLKAASASSGQ